MGGANFKNFLPSPNWESYSLNLEYNIQGSTWTLIKPDLYQKINGRIIPDPEKQYLPKLVFPPKECSKICPCWRWHSCGWNRTSRVRPTHWILHKNPLDVLNTEFFQSFLQDWCQELVSWLSFLQRSNLTIMQMAAAGGDFQKRKNWTVFFSGENEI